MTDVERSSMFYASDLLRAAEDAADAMEEHGLSPEQVEELAGKVRLHAAS